MRRQMRSYIGITIGPIYDTLCEASSPASLWFASSMFSDITKRICESIVSESMFKEVEIYSPYYPLDKVQIEGKSDGVGKYHDRIIFSTETFSHDIMKGILDKAKEETICWFPKTMQNDNAKNFLKTYLQIHYVVKKEEQINDKNCVLALSPYLDAMELMKNFPVSDKSSPIHEVFAGKKDNRNCYVKEILGKTVMDEANQFMNSQGKIWEIQEIASWHNQITEAWKRKNYYAVVSADGDAMGKFLEKISNNDVTEFSKLCLKYDEEAAKKIGEYGGMTIYAGGDDLLFLAPIMTTTSNIFSLCHEIQKLFVNKIKSCKKFMNMVEIPSISFGIAIQYVKYPLYEALENSRHLLALAKKDGDYAKEGHSCNKNNMLIELQKHSGQKLALIVSNDCYGSLETFMQLGNSQEQIHSIIYTLHKQAGLIGVLDQLVLKKIQEDIEHKNIEKYQQYIEKCKQSWKNLFDNAEQAYVQDYIDTICDIYYKKLVLAEKKGIYVPNESLKCVDKELMENSSLQTLLYLLRLNKFLVEKEGV